MSNIENIQDDGEKKQGLFSGGKINVESEKSVELFSEGLFFSNPGFENEENSESKDSSLFPKEEETGLFSGGLFSSNLGLENEENSESKTSALFPKEDNKSQGLFSQEETKEGEEKEKAPQSTGLFSGVQNLNTTSPSVGLFSTNNLQKTSTTNKESPLTVKELFGTQTRQENSGKSASLFTKSKKKISPSEGKLEGIYIDFECDIPFLDKTMEIKVYEKTLAADLIRYIVLEELKGEITGEEDLDQFILHFEGEPVSPFKRISDFDFSHESRFTLQQKDSPIEFEELPYPPKLSKIGYQTIPPFEELIKMKNSELSSVKFSIFNQNVRIDYKERCNLIGVNLDDIFNFEHASVKVYAGDTVKPVRGSGFNKEAIVTLLNLGVPKEDGEEFDQFERKALKLVNQKNAYFLRVDGKSDSLSFKVLEF